MSKIISFNLEAKEKLKKGIDKVNNAVATTMGPWGRNVLIEKEHGQVVSTKDGVTVAKTITLEDPIENIAATIIKQAAQKTVDAAGDGTTTSTVLAHSIASQAFKVTSYPSVNVTKVKKGIEAAVKQVVEGLKEISVDITDENQIKQIATLSANGDEEIGNLIAMALDKVGRDGIVTVEESKSGETSLETVEGIQLNNGYKSPYFVTDNNLMASVLNDPYILIYNGRISAVKDLLPILERVSSENKSLLIIAEDIDGEALATLVMNKARGVLKVCAIKAPGFGDYKVQVLEDVATLTGGTVVSQDRGMTLAKFNTSWLGKARVITVNRDTTTIVDGKGEEEKINERILSIKSQIDTISSPYEVERLQERLGKMIGGVAVINVGGNNEIEIKEKKDRVDDSLQAAKAALEEGILPGAGVALLHAREAISYAKIDGEDFNNGKRIVFKACSTPFEQILNNANIAYQQIIYDIINNLPKNNLVPNIEEEILVDAYNSGIVDPTKVVRSALENAASAAVTLLMTECVIHENPSDKKKEDFGMSEFGM